MGIKIHTSMLFLSMLVSIILGAKFGEPPAGWGDIRFGLVSNGVPTDPDTKRLKSAVEELGIKLDYRYRYVNEGVDPAKNACANMFPKKWSYNYAKDAKKDAGVESSYVIYILQEEGGRIKLLENMADPIKARQFFHTLRIVAENANGHNATIIVEPDTWGYLMQDRYQTIENTSIEVDPLLIPAVVNNIPDSTYFDSIPDPDEPWDVSKIQVTEKPLTFDYLSDLPNNMSGFGRAIIRTLHKYAPDCYVGFLASHWSVNLGLDGAGWSSDGMVWATPALLDTSAKLNIEFFSKFYYGSISDESPAQPGDLPDFIGVEKNGWCAGTWEAKDGRTYWYWGDEQMQNYLRWVKQIAQGLDLPVVGWQISIGNMDNPNTADETNMANAYKDTFFPYFFSHKEEFFDAGFIGFLVGKGLSQATDYTLPGEGVGENGWFFNQLLDFDQGRPYLDTSKQTSVSVSTTQEKGKLFMRPVQNGISLQFSQFYAEGTRAEVSLYSLNGQLVSSLSAPMGAQLYVPTGMLAKGSYILKVSVNGDNYVRKVSNAF